MQRAMQWLNVGLIFWLKRPHLLFARIRYFVWGRMNSSAPWLCPGTLEFCEKNLRRSMNTVEFGSGRSTAWFSMRVKHLISVEHDAHWFEIVKTKLTAAKITNVDYRMIPLDHPESEPERREYTPIPNYVAVAKELKDKSINFAIVDGHYRTNCVRQLVSKIAPCGYLLVDDINMWPSRDSLPVPTSWIVANDSTNGLKRCVIWQAP